MAMVDMVMVDTDMEEDMVIVEGMGDMEEEAVDTVLEA